MASFLKNIHPLLKRSRKYSTDDPNGAFLGAIDTTLSEIERDTIQAKVNGSLKTATGEFLELWGDWHGITRSLGETDTELRDRITNVIKEPRGTVQSIIDGVRHFMGRTDVAVFAQETWQDIFWLNSSRLNSESHLMGDIYRYGVVLITIDKNYPAYILELIALYKPAGVTVIVNYSETYQSIDYYTGDAIEGQLEYNKVYFIK